MRICYFAQCCRFRVLSITCCTFVVLSVWTGFIFNSISHLIASILCRYILLTTLQNCLDYTHKSWMNNKNEVIYSWFCAEDCTLLFLEQIWAYAWIIRDWSLRPESACLMFKNTEQKPPSEKKGEGEVGFSSFVSVFVFVFVTTIYDGRYRPLLGNFIIWWAWYEWSSDRRI